MGDRVRATTMPSDVGHGKPWAYAEVSWEEINKGFSLAVDFTELYVVGFGLINISTVSSEVNVRINGDKCLFAIPTDKAGTANAERLTRTYVSKYNGLYWYTIAPSNGGYYDGDTSGAANWGWAMRPSTPGHVPCVPATGVLSGTLLQLTINYTYDLTNGTIKIWYR